jgi:methylated-DNA-[protein]-cysteine S-methyltransferase
MAPVRTAPGTPHHYHLFETALGVCGIAWTAGGLTRVQLPERDERTTERRLQDLNAIRHETELPPSIAHAVALLRAYVGGAPTDFRDIALDDNGISDFNAKIYRALRAIGFGTTTTYGALADAVESPGAARAVGMAMARNPWPIIVPCHRVLASGQRMGGFSAPGGTLTKEQLLALEGVHLGDGGTPLLPGLGLFPTARR